MSSEKFLQQPNVQALFTALLSLKSTDETALFLRDLMTETEITELARRLQAASLLNKKVSYTEIIRQTGLSSTTVARISRWLNGPGGGYRTVLPRIHNN